MQDKIIVKEIKSIETRPLRQSVLRTNWTLEQLFYEGDDDIDTYHAGAFDKEKIIGIASVYRKAKKGENNNNSWQLRGMAVDPEYRGKGIGKLTLENCINYIKSKNGKILWCNARLVAVDFYKSFGFAIKSDLFEIDDIGPHYIMDKLL